MHLKFLLKFKRITYSTSYLPEVDGLRFVAIFSVVVIMHIPNYLNEKFYNNEFIPQGYWKSFSIAGGHGVDLFFVISGFILSLPFAKWRINKAKKVSLKKYYLRRLTRLEPPYVIALTIFFIANIWVLNTYSFKVLFPHFLTSAAYLHTIVYHSFSWILPVAWSLEVEVQFYILAPLFFLIYAIPLRAIRSTIFLLVIIIGSYYWFDHWGVGNVFTFLRLFFMGMLLSDLYCTKTVLFKNKSFGFVIGVLSLVGFLFVPSIYYDETGLHYGIGYLAKMVFIFFLFHCVLTNGHIRKLFSAQLIVIIGGMCYSIYLLHLAIISAAGTILIKAGTGLSQQFCFPLWALLFILITLVISAIYFLLIEKPFMKPRGALKK
jgi:peptidoglycan/LPS O-acetylase OafA/YrhL